MRSGSTTLRAPPLERQRELKHPPVILHAGVFVVQTTTDCVGGVEKDLAMKRAKKLLLV